ncbi:epoxide hydrolase [Paenibacillus peoriae]|uniref:epoxide hydrolase family protein n=1 Tax=Paenibacillus peoriae TaxID=59893 RepID=UPI0030D59862
MEPFKISIPEQQLHDLSIRLKQVRWPSSFSVEPWALGTDRSFLKRLVDYWSTEYNWREQEAWLNRFPQFMEHVDGFDIHFVHVRGEGTSARPLLLTHGWPGSFVEMLELIPYLTTPSLYGGHAEEAFDVIIPSLPGFAFSSKPTRPGVGAKYVATLWAKLMDRLDYERYLVQGGDIGAGVSTWLAFMYPERVMGLHLNYIPGSYKPPLTPNTPSVSEEEQAYLDIVAEWLDREGAYSALHRTKPETLAFALSDSPTGLASWMVENFKVGVTVTGISKGLSNLIISSLTYRFTGLPIRLLLPCEYILKVPKCHCISPKISVLLFQQGFPYFPRSCPRLPEAG